MVVSESDSSFSQISKISIDRLNKLSNSNSVEIKNFHETLSFRKSDSGDSDSEFHSVSASDCDTAYSKESSLNTNSNSFLKEISTSSECSEIQAYSDNQKTLCTLSPKSQKLIYCNSILENSKDFKKASLTFERQEETLLNDTNSELCQTPSATQKNQKIIESYLPLEHSQDSNDNSHKNQVASEPVFSCFSSVRKPKSSKRKSASEIQKGLRIQLRTSENHLPKEHSLDSNSILYENQAEFERLERNSSNDVCLSQNEIQNPVNDYDSEYISRSLTLKIPSKSRFSDKISHLKKKRYTRKKPPKTPKYIPESESDIAGTQAEIPKLSLDKSSHSKKRKLWSALLEYESDGDSNSMEINELGTSVKEIKKSRISNCSLDESSYSKKRRPTSLVLESDSESFKTSEILTEKGIETISGTNNMDVNKLENINESNVKTVRKISPSAKPNCSLDKFIQPKKRKLRSAILVSESDSESIQTNKILTEKGLETISDTNNIDVNKLETISETNNMDVNELERINGSNINQMQSPSTEPNCSLDKFSHSKKKRLRSAILISESDSDSIQTDKILTDKLLETKIESYYYKKRKPVPLETDSDNDSSEILTVKELKKISDLDGMEINKLVNDCNISCRQDIFPAEYISNKEDSVKNMPVCDIREKLCPLQPLFEMGDINAKKLVNTSFNHYFLKDASCISENVLNEISFNKEESLLDDKHESNNELTKHFRDKSTNLAYRKKLSTENVVSITLPETQYPFGVNNDSIKHLHFELNKDLHIKSDSNRLSVHSEMMNVSYHYFHCYGKNQFPLLNENSTTALSCNSLQISPKTKTQDVSGEISQSSCNLPKFETSYCDEFKNRLKLQFKKLIHNSPLSLQFQVKSGSDNCMSNKDLTQSVTQLMINQPVCGLIKPFSEKNSSRYLVEQHSNDFLAHKKQIRRKQVLPKRFVTKSLKSNWIYWSKMDISQQIKNYLAYPIINCSYLKHPKNKSGVFLCKGKCFRNVKNRFEVYLQNKLILFNYKISSYPIVDLGQKCDNSYFKQSQRSSQQKHLKHVQLFCGNSVKCNKYNLSKSNYKNSVSTSNNLLGPSFLRKRKQFCSLIKNVHMSETNESTANHSHNLNHLAEEDVTKTNNTEAQSMLTGYNLRKRRKCVFACCN